VLSLVLAALVFMSDMSTFVELAVSYGAAAVIWLAVWADRRAAKGAGE
jgi:hypothetical protein